LTHILIHSVSLFIQDLRAFGKSNHSLSISDALQRVDPFLGLFETLTVRSFDQKITSSGNSMPIFID
jgi:hypothetical protein